MGKIFHFFNRKHLVPKNQKPQAVAFIDYEHWYISLNNLYHIKPDLKGWLKDLSRRVDVREIIFFADFSNTSLEAEIPKIREISNKIIETKNTNSRFKKDFTDFIMLDSIYQKAMFDKEIDTFVLFTGDGHFASAVSFLVNRCGKDVGVYGVKDAFSLQLKNTASWFIEVPLHAEDDYSPYYKMLLTSLSNAENKKGRNAKPTFQKTVQVVSNYHHIPVKTMQTALEQLITQKYVIREKQGRPKPTDKLTINWKKCAEDGIFASQKESVRLV